MSKVEAKWETYVQPLHQSSISMCLQCKRCYMFKYRWCIFSKAASFSPSLSLGKIVHRLLQLGPDRVAEVEDEVNTQIAELNKRIANGEDFLGELGKTITGIQDMFKKGMAMVSVLWEKFPPSPNMKSLGRELTINAKVELGTTPTGEKTETEIAGTVDEILESKETGATYVKDFKTTARNTTYTLAGYQYSLQARIYRLLASFYIKKAPDGFILEILQTPTIKYCKKDKDFDAYVERVKKWFDDKGKEAVDSFAIRFNEVEMPPELAAALRIAAAYRLAPPVPELFHRDVTGSYCKSYDRLCDYYPLCSRDESSWIPMIEDKYEVRPPVTDEVHEKKTAYIVEPEQSVIASTNKIIVPGA